jgi:hypothetical protein
MNNEELGRYICHEIISLPLDEEALFSRYKTYSTYRKGKAIGVRTKVALMAEVHLHDCIDKIALSHPDIKIDSCPFEYRMLPADVEIRYANEAVVISRPDGRLQNEKEYDKIASIDSIPFAFEVKSNPRSGNIGHALRDGPAKHAHLKDVFQNALVYIVLAPKNKNKTEPYEYRRGAHIAYFPFSMDQLEEATIRMIIENNLNARGLAKLQRRYDKMMAQATN